MGGFSIGQATPCLKNFAIGKQAAVKIFSVLDRKPKIIVENLNGFTKPDLKGDIAFNNVEFTYPAKPDQKVIKNISFKIAPN